MLFPDDSRLQKVRIQLNLQIQDGCSQNTLYCSLRQRLIESFKTVPLFQEFLVSLSISVACFSYPLKQHSNPILQLKWLDSKAWIQKDWVQKASKSGSSASIVLAAGNPVVWRLDQVCIVITCPKARKKPGEANTCLSAAALVTLSHTNKQLITSQHEQT